MVPHSPLATMVLHSLLTILVLHSPLATMVLHSPLATMVLHSLLATIVLHSPLATLVLHSPLATMVLHSPLATLVLHSPLATMVSSFAVGYNGFIICRWLLWFYIRRLLQWFSGFSSNLFSKYMNLSATKRPFGRLELGVGKQHKIEKIMFYAFSNNNIFVYFKLWTTRLTNSKLFKTFIFGVVCPCFCPLYALISDMYH